MPTIISKSTKELTYSEDKVYIDTQDTTIEQTITKAYVLFELSQLGGAFYRFEEVKKTSCMEKLSDMPGKEVVINYIPVTEVSPLTLEVYVKFEDENGFHIV